MKYLTRQLDIIPMEILKEPINIIGAGAIGSHAATYLAKMGCYKITVWDFDSVSEENMNSQGYRIADIGMPKVLALKDIVKSYTGIDIEVKFERYTNSSPIMPGVVISCVDSMSARKLIWDKNKVGSMKYFIDSRMGAEEAMLYTVNPRLIDECKNYEASLYSDDEAETPACTAKATCYTATMLSGLVCKAVKDVLTAQPYPKVAWWFINNHSLEIHKGGEVGISRQSDEASTGTAG